MTERGLTLVVESITPEVISAQPNMTAAIKLGMQITGNDAKNFYIDLGIDKSHWSKMLNNQAHFPPDKLPEFMTLCGNLIPLQWLAQKMNFGLHVLESEQERIIREKDERITELEAKYEHAIQIMKDIS